MANERMQASEFRADLREALNRVEYNGVHIEIHRRNKVAGVLLPWADYLRLVEGGLSADSDQPLERIPSSHDRPESRDRYDSPYRHADRDKRDDLDTATEPQQPQPNRDDWMEWNK